MFWNGRKQQIIVSIIKRLSNSVCHELPKRKSLFEFLHFFFHLVVNYTPKRDFIATLLHLFNEYLYAIEQTDLAYVDLNLA